MSAQVATGQKGILHLYTKNLTAFEHTPGDQNGPHQNIILFIGGLFDGFMTIPYPTILAAALPETWTLAQVLLSSSYKGWGTSSVSRDASELAKCVAYFRKIGKSGKIVLMGSSTGCQDVMEYLTGAEAAERLRIDGGILQAPVSDREAIVMSMTPDSYRSSCEVAKKMVDQGLGDEIVPASKLNSMFPAPTSARRWLSLASPNHDGDEDFFSSDLTDEQLSKTFGQLSALTPLCVLISGSDEYMPASVDKAGLLQRWSEIAKKGEGSIDIVNSGVVEGASHNYAKNGDEIVADLVRRILGFINGLPARPYL